MNWFWRLFEPPHKMKIALAVGHSRKIGNRLDGGAVSVGDVSEWEYNTQLADMIQDILEGQGHTVEIWESYAGKSYGGAMAWLADDIKEWGADCAIELHFNAATPGANGHEWLYWQSSDKGRLLAASINKAFMDTGLPIKQRGIKALNHNSRGALFCRLTHCPAVIAEPFFGSNSDDWAIATSQKATIAEGIASGILDWIQADW